MSRLLLLYILHSKLAEAANGILEPPKNDFSLAPTLTSNCKQNVDTGSCFVDTGEKASITDAQAKCSALGGYLPIIMDYSDHFFIHQFYDGNEEIPVGMKAYSGCAGGYKVIKIAKKT